jgi:hypothetical protein
MAKERRGEWPRYPVRRATHVPADVGSEDVLRREVALRRAAAMPSACVVVCDAPRLVQVVSAL